jgi:hypothetical protein
MRFENYAPNWNITVWFYNSLCLRVCNIAFFSASDPVSLRGKNMGKYIPSYRH